MLHSIAVTTDFSDASRKSLAAAALLAKRFRARLEIVRVSEGPDDAKRLEDFARQSPALADLEVETRLLHGEAPEVLRRFQESEGLDLVVVASHGHGDVKSFLLGSFATRAIRAVTCPVLVFREMSAGAQPERKEGQPEQPVFTPRRILVPHDFSATSAYALETARSWARAFGASVRILFVEPPLADRGEGEATRALARLREIVQRDWEGIPAEPVTTTGNPVEEILAEAGSLHADLICLASHGLSGPGGRPLGSVAERVIHRARCPVLVVKRVRP